MPVLRSKREAASVDADCQTDKCAGDDDDTLDGNLTDVETDVGTSDAEVEELLEESIKRRFLDP